MDPQAGERVAEATDGAAQVNADDLLPAVAKHVVFARMPHVHSELAFIGRFCRDDPLVLGREGYAMATLAAAVRALEAMPLDEAAELVRR